MTSCPIEDQVSFRSIAQWLRAAAQCDINLAELLHEAGLSSALTHPDSFKVARQKVNRLMHRCIELARVRRPDLCFPLALADAFGFEYTSDLEAFVTSAPTLRDAAGMLDWLPVFYDPGMRVTLSEFGAQARLTIQYNHAQSDLANDAPFMEMMAAGFVRFGRLLLTGQEFKGYITFRHAPNSYSETYTRSLDVPVQYEQPLDAIWFDRSLLDRKLRGGLIEIHQASAKRLEENVRALQHARLPPALTGTAGVLTHALLTQPELLMQDQEQVAQHLNMGVRTLQRRLGREQTSYSDVVDGVRHQLAKAWLSDKRLSIEDISVRLGFSNRMGLTQAFHRWCAMTPTQYRKFGKV